MDSEHKYTRSSPPIPYSEMEAVILEALCFHHPLRTTLTLPRIWETEGDVITLIAAITKSNFLHMDELVISQDILEN